MKATSGTQISPLPPDGRGGSIPIFPADTERTQTITLSDSNVVKSSVFSSTKSKIVRVVVVDAMAFIGTESETLKQTATASMPVLQDSSIEIPVPAGGIITVRGNKATVYLTPSLD